MSICALTPEAASIRDQIVDLVRRRDNVTLAEVAQLDGVGGDIGIEVGTPDPNTRLCIWVGLSEAAADALDELIQPGSPIAWVPTSAFTYLYDGAAMQMPVATVRTIRERISRRPKTAKTFWLPVCLRPVDRVEPRDRFRPIPEQTSSPRSGKETIRGPL